MKLSIKWVGVIVFALMLTIVGCSNSKEPEKTNSNNTPATNNNETAKGNNDAGTPAGKQEFTMYVTDLAKAVPTGNLLDDPTIAYMAEKSGVTPNITFLANANYVDQLKLKFAASEFPDVYMGFGLTQGDGALDNDLILPLNELIEEHAPNMKKVIPQYAWDAVTINGKIMAIPEPSNTPSSRVFYARKDWMDAVGITEFPKTSDELLDMLRKFRDEDPNGNGEKDEIPFTTREKFAYTGDMIWGMWGISPYEGIELDGEVVPGFIHPNMKKGLEFMQTMYKEGLLDSEFLLNSTAITEQKITSGVAGVWGSVPNNAYNYQKNVSESLPGTDADVVVFPTPRGTGHDGPIGSVNFKVNKSYLVMKSAKDPVAVVKFFDWLFSEEGQIFSEIGVEGVNYAKTDDKFFYRPDSEAEAKTEWRSVLRMHAHNETAFAAKYSGVQFEKMSNSIAVANQEGLESLTMGMPAVGQNLFSLYYEFHEPAARIIVEGEDVDKVWDEFVKNWRAQGGQELIDEMTNWVNENKQ